MDFETKKEEEEIRREVREIQNELRGEAIEGLEKIIMGQIAFPMKGDPVYPNPTAVLSTVVLPVDGIYWVETLDLCSGLSTLEAHCKEGKILHFVDHPATRKVVEACGAVSAGQGILFAGLEVGQWALCFPIAQGKSDRSQGGSAIHQEVNEQDLSCRRVTRLA